MTEAEVRRVVRMYPTYALAAHALGVTRMTLYNWRRKWDIDRATERGLVEFTE